MEVLLLIIAFPIVVLALLFALFLLYLPLYYLRVRLRWPLRMWRSLDDLPAMAVPQGYQLRSYEGADSEGWVQLAEVAFAAQGLPFTRWRRLTWIRALRRMSHSNRERILVAEREANGRLVGTVIVHYSPPARGRREGLICNLAVHPEDRRRGLGYALAAAALHDLRGQGHTYAMLHTHPWLRDAVHLYERLGFTPVGRGGSVEPLSKRSGQGASTG